MAHKDREVQTKRRKQMNRAKFEVFQRAGLIHLTHVDLAAAMVYVVSSDALYEAAPKEIFKGTIPQRSEGTNL